MAKQKEKEDKAVGIKIPADLYSRLAEVCEEVDSPVTRFIIGSIEATLELVSPPPGTDIHLPKYIAVTRLKKHWAEIGYEGDLGVIRDPKKGE